MNNEFLYGAIIILAGIIIYLFTRKNGVNAMQKELGNTVKHTNTRQQQDTLPLRLQAYERLTLLADRIAIPHLIQRLANSALSAKLQQQDMVQNIRQEFEHNITQQIYVSRKAWNAVNHLKEQNIMLLHQIAGKLPETANGLEYCQALLEHLSQNPAASLYENVSEILAEEAQMLM